MAGPGQPPSTSRRVDSPPPAIVRNRLVHSIASALSRTSISAQPPISSLASENGPSSTVNSPSAYLTLMASAGGRTPPVASSTPAWVASATNAPIFSYIAGSGGGNSVFGSPRVYPRNRIASPDVRRWSATTALGFLTRASNASVPDRHHRKRFLEGENFASARGLGARGR